MRAEVPSDPRLLIRNATARRVVVAVLIYCASTLLVILGVWFGSTLVVRAAHPFQGIASFSQTDGGMIASMTAWDGVWYARIVRNGYTYDPEANSSVAFFPGYPIVAKAARVITGLSAELSLLVVGHLCLLFSFVLTSVYLDGRSAENSEAVGEYSLLALGFWPTTAFFHMAYSESLFVLLLVLAMLAMKCRWSPVAIAIIIGAATGTRAVGVALLPVFLLHLRESRWPGPFLFQSACLLPLACWGLLAWMLYQHVEFGDALAFVKTQEHWTAREIDSTAVHVQALVTLEPIWSPYASSSEAYWRRQELVRNPLFSLQFANPLYFVATATLVLLGAAGGWLNRREWLLAALLLLIPYITHSYRGLMYSQGRYTSVVFPAYMVFGHFAARAPVCVTVPLFGLSAFMLGAYSALFAAWYRIF